MEIPNRAIATAEAADIVVTRLEKAAAYSQVSVRELSRAIIPVFGIRWSADVVRRIGSRRINPLLQKLRNSELPLPHYNRLASLWKDAHFDDVTAFPPKWENWRTLIERFALDEVANLRDWIPTVQRCVNQQLTDPQVLAAASQSQLNTLLAGASVASNARKLWRAAVVAFADPPSGDLETMLMPNPDADSLLRAIRGTSFTVCGAANAVTEACQRLKVKTTFLSLGPSAKMKLLRKNCVSQKTMDSFFKKKSQHIALTGVRKTLPSFASGVRSYFSFCELKRVRPFPVKESTVIQWSSLFRSGGAFSNYVGYLKKACFFLNTSVSWDTPAVRNIVKALKLSAKSNLRFPNFLTSREVGMILEHEQGGEFGWLAYFAYLFALRVPSEALGVRRAFSNDPLEGFLPLKNELLVGVRGPAGEEKLIFRLASRKHLPAGCILVRPCFCGLRNGAAHALCPVHVFWPAIQERVRPGQLLFPSYTRRNFNCVLRAVLKKLSIPFAERFSSHGFRRGAAQELQPTGSQWTTVASLGCWRSLVFKGYVDLTNQVSRDLSRLLAMDVSLDSDSDEDED